MSGGCLDASTLIVRRQSEGESNASALSQGMDKNHSVRVGRAAGMDARDCMTCDHGRGSAAKDLRCVRLREAPVT